ncbi:unnamed protein product [Rotaria socialis]|uniref:Potassium channel domain-containing protein n=2 Tax=Rotaria socialis TaxID=392032 RepID=A0A818N6H5_9BILA|nr:unnamed protein product [Rotaria socialis]CAF3499875.1 unnamed protein product [Rotaria socialis]CAF3601424.1 unnamed protein product [Rotaria socialis]CAF4484302.1 unnamed protein product [Rotaria socialis]CAF4495918.1 unnamed protein product [Rotaria socialis]
MNYVASYDVSGYDTPTIAPFSIISSKPSHRSEKPNELKLAPLVSFDEHGDIPIPTTHRPPSSVLITTSQPDAIAPNCYDLRSWKEFRKNFTRFIVPCLWSQLGLFVLVFVYIAFGGLIFYSIESKYESHKIQQIKIKHLHGIHNIRQIANDEFNWVLNASFELRYALWRGMLSRLDGNDNVGWRVQVHIERFDRLIENELARMQAEQEKLTDKHDSRTDAAYNQKWTFSTAMLYSATVISTVGYGNITPKSILGKLTTCFYAAIGIPLMIMYLANTGDLLAFFFVKYYSVTRNLVDRIIRQQSRRRRRRQEQLTNLPFELEHQTVQYQVPIPATLGILTLYIVVGAALFSNWEGWSYIDAAYFSFITFTTIGLGDLVPGKGTLTDNKHGKSILCALYLLYGLVITTMCFKLLQDDLFAIKRRIFTRLGFDAYQYYYHYHHFHNNRRYLMRLRENNK